MQNRYGNGRIIYAAGSVVEFSEAKAKQAEANRWGQIIGESKPERKTGVDIAASVRSTAAEITPPAAPQTTRKRRTRKKKTDN